MAKYRVTFSCGHTETVQLFGKTSERERWISWAENNKVCPECYETQKEEARQAATQAAAQEAEENGLPSLTGSDKQVAWAETIRAEVLAEINRLAAPLDANVSKVLANSETLEKANQKAVADGFADFEDSAECLKIAINQIKGITSAHWWIENRNVVTRRLFLAEKAQEVAKARKEKAPAAINAKAEATIRPESPITETVAEIRILETKIEVSFPEKREDFWQIIKKELGYIWADTCWKRNITFKTGTAADRAAETGNKLLSAGFIVRIFDPVIREAAINGTFEPECKRWVAKRTSGTYDGWFAVDWEGRAESLYSAARKLKGSKYDNKTVVVPPEHFDEVQDFAGLYGFRFSPGAQELIDRARQAREAAMIAKPVSVVYDAPPVPGQKPKKLTVPESVEVADEFKD